MKKIITVLLSVLLIAGLFTGCNGDAVSEVVNPKLLRSFDSVWLGDKPPYGEFSQALYGEIVNFVSSGSKEADAVFVNDFEKISEEDLTYLLKMGMENIPIIIIDPDVGDISILQDLSPENYDIENLSESIFFRQLDALADDLEAMAAEGGEWEAVGIRGADVYLVFSPNDSGHQEVVYEWEGEYEGGAENPETVGDEPKTQLDINKIRVEDFCEWIAEKYDAGIRTAVVQGRDAGSSLDLKNCFRQRVGFSFEAPGPLNNHTGYYPAVIEFEAIIRPVYSFDENRDYYVVEENIKVNNEPMKCGPNQIEGWCKKWDGQVHKGTFIFENEKWDGYYGIYLREVAAHHTAPAGFSLKEYEPKTTQRSQSFSEGFSFSLSGNVGLGTSGPSLTLGGGVSYSNSKSVTIPDLGVVVSEGPIWKYKAREPEIKAPGFLCKTPRHDFAPDVTSKGIHTYRNNWRWESPVNPSGSYQCSFDAKAFTGLLLGYANMLYYRGWSYSNGVGVLVKTTLMPPCRYKNERWTCGFETLDGQPLSPSEIAAVDSYLKKLSGGWWDASVCVYSVTEGENATAAKAGFKTAVDRFENNVDYFRRTLRLKGRYRFYMYDSTSPTTKSATWTERTINMGGM